MGGESWISVCEFESRHRKLDGWLFAFGFNKSIFLLLVKTENKKINSPLQSFYDLAIVKLWVFNHAIEKNILKKKDCKWTK